MWQIYDSIIQIEPASASLLYSHKMAAQIAKQHG